MKHWKRKFYDKQREREDAFRQAREDNAAEAHREATRRQAREDNAAEAHREATRQKQLLIWKEEIDRVLRTREAEKERKRELAARQEISTLVDYYNQITGG